MWRVPQGEPGELAHQVGLLVGQRAAGQHGVGVGTELVADAQEPVGGEIERLLPAGLDEHTVAAHERHPQAVAVLDLLPRGRALRAHRTAGERRTLPAHLTGDRVARRW